MLKFTRRIDYDILFKIIYLLHLLFCFNCFTFKMKVLDITTFVVMFLGMGILLYRVIHVRNYVKTKFLLIMFLFLCSFGISSLINLKYGMMGNIKGGVWMMFHFFLLYCLNINEDKIHVQKEMKIISLVLIIYTSIASLFGIIMMFNSYGGRFNFEDGSGSFYGFVWGRLWGCYTDPNHGAIVTAVAIILALYLIVVCNKVSLRAVLVLTIILNYLYIVFSDSRSAKLSLALALLVFVGLGSANLVKGKKKIHIIIAGLFTIGLTCCIYMSFGIVKDVYNYYITWSIDRRYEQVINNEQETFDELSLEKAKEEERQNVTLGREGDIENDVSNRRFDIWQSAGEIFCKNKVFGVGFRNITNYAKNELPDTYIVNNDHGAFDSFHNVAFDVLVSQGIIGIGLMLIMGLSVAFYLIKKIIIEQQYQMIEIRVLFAAVLILLFDSMFISAIFYVNSPETILFWMLLGYLVHIVGKQKAKRKCVENV